MQDEINHPFEAPRTVVSDNAMSSTARFSQDLLELHKAEWYTVLANAPILNGIVKMMVGAIKRVIGSLVNGTEKEWDEIVHRVVFRYRRCLLRNGLFSFLLLHG